MTRHGVLFLASMFLLTASAASVEERLQIMHRHHPEADANGDGSLTELEAMDYVVHRLELRQAAVAVGISLRVVPMHYLKALFDRGSRSGQQKHRREKKNAMTGHRNRSLTPAASRLILWPSDHWSPKRPAPCRSQPPLTHAVLLGQH